MDKVHSGKGKKTTIDEEIQALWRYFGTLEGRVKTLEEKHPSRSSATPPPPVIGTSYGERIAQAAEKIAGIVSGAAAPGRTCHQATSAPPAAPE